MASSFNAPTHRFINVQEEIARNVYQAAAQPLTDSIARDQDAVLAALALQLQRIEAASPAVPEVHDDDSERIAWQMQEQLEQEHHDATVAQTLGEEERNRQTAASRVPHLNDALNTMRGDSRRGQNRNMNFGQSVRGPSMHGLRSSGGPNLELLGPAVFIENDIDTDGLQAESILPRPRVGRQRRSNHRAARGGNINIFGDDSSSPTGPEDDAPGSLPGRFRLPVIQDQPRIATRERRRMNEDRNDQQPSPFQGAGLFHALRRNLHDHHGNHIGHHRDFGDIDFNDYDALWELQESNGDVGQRGLTKEQINRIPHHKFKSKPGLYKTLRSDKNSCSICLTDYQENENIKTLPCFHSFHKSCIEKWIKSQAVCPVCRQNIKTR